MGSSSDLERIDVGSVFDENDPKTIRDLSERIVKMEQILSKNTTQWNAPTLVRGRIDNSPNILTEHLYIQGGVETLTYDEWTAAVVDKQIDFPIGFDKRPVVVVTLKESDLDSTEVTTYAHGTTKDKFDIQITTAGAPTSGGITFVWIAIAEKEL